MESQTRHLLDYEGREIRLTTERLAHILSHPEMVGMEARVEEALREPERVIQSPSDPGVHLYYRRYFDTPVGDKILCIVVKVEVEDPFIITAYLADRVRHGRVLWERNR